MHIGIDIRVLGTGRLSGVEEYTSHLLEHLIPLDPSISYTLLSLGRVRPKDESWMNATNVRRVHSGRSNRASFLTMQLMGYPKLDVLAGNPDLFFFPHFLYGALSHRCRRVITFHDLSYDRFPEFFTVRRRVWHQLQMRPKKQAHMADRLIAVSHATATDLHERYFIERDRISVIHSGVDETLGPPSEADLLAFRRYENLHDPFILSMSTREPRKNLVGLIRAFERVAQMPGAEQVQLIIAGPPGWQSREFEKVRRKSKFVKRIRVIGEIDPSARSLWYGAATVLAYPSFFEGFGFPPLEAMACGTPVVASRTSSLPEVVGDAGLLIDPYDIQELALVLHQVIMDKDFARHLAERGTERVSRFSWSRTAEQTLEALIHTLP